MKRNKIFAGQVAALSDSDLARHASVGKLCHCGICFCCYAKFEQLERKERIAREAKEAIYTHAIGD